MVEGNTVSIVDEFTGRVLDGRRWGDGLQQAVEVKEGLTASNVSQVVASVTYQSLFKQYERLSGMSGTATQEVAEFQTVYGLRTVSVPTAAPMARRDYPDVVFVSPEGKRKAFVDEVRRMHDTGRPVLVGTSSVADSEALSEDLAAVNISHNVLNARPEKARKENLVIAQAGRLNAVTISTNMAGRGTDILLGGNPDVLARTWLLAEVFPEVSSEEAEAVSYPAQVSGDAQALAAAAAKALADDGVVARDDIARLVARAAAAGPVAPDSAEASLRAAYEAVRAIFAEALAEEQEQVVSLGGLHVIGTQRHESRRIDAQLRGRAGRQGDPGSSRFILSLEDDLFRVFGGDKVKGLFNALRLSEDTPIESKQVACLPLERPHQRAAWTHPVPPFSAPLVCR